MYLKRNNVPKQWPLERKGSKYVAKPNHGLENSLPIVIILRDMLNLVENKKEVKKLLNLGKIKVNNKKVYDVKYPLTLFDIIDLDGQKYKLTLQNKKFKLEEVKTDTEKICKIIGKKLLKKGKIQVNLSDGRNYLFDKKVNINDSAVIDFNKNTISKVIPLEKGREVLFVVGKHISEIGKIEDINNKNQIIVKTEKDKINTSSESLIVIN